MQDLKVIGVEDGALVAAAENGDRYRLAIDEVLQSQLRRMKSTSAAEAPKVRPRDIQAHIRSGLSAQEVAALTGADIDYIQRFESPILAEREHMVFAALSVPVVATIAPGTELEDATFGAAIRARLESLSAEGERWSSWKDVEEGWIIKLSFTANRVDHDARWGFEPRRNTLTPNNSEAITLSKQGELPPTLIPRLRAVEATPAASVAETPREDRFDTDPYEILSPDASPSPAPLAASAHANTGEIHGRIPAVGANAAADAAINRADSRGDDGNQHTADLLQALRKRRGERESRGQETGPVDPAAGHAPDVTPEAAAPRPAEDADTGFGLRPVDVPLENFERLERGREASAEGATRGEGAAEPRNAFGLRIAPTPGEAADGGSPAGTAEGASSDAPAAPEAGQGGQADRDGGPRGRRARKAMPSWDEIVFGARGDDNS